MKCVWNVALQIDHLSIISNKKLDIELGSTSNVYIIPYKIYKTSPGLSWVSTHYWAAVMATVIFKTSFFLYNISSHIFCMTFL